MSDSGRKTLGIKVLPKKEFAEQEKTSEEKIQALGGATWLLGTLVVKSPGCLGIPWEWGNQCQSKTFSWVKCS